MNTKYITIEREYGSGGSRIGRLLSEETGIPCYGREILEAVSYENGISVDEIERYEEKMTNSLLYSIYVLAQASAGSSDMLSMEGRVFVAEQEQIQRLAKKGKAIFLGHCASEALKNDKNVIRVFIRCSSEDEKKKRIMEDYGIKESLVESTRKHYDKKRSNYYNANTMKRWEDWKNYDIVLDSGVLGIEGCVSVLKGLF